MAARRRTRSYRGSRSLDRPTAAGSRGAGAARGGAGASLEIGDGLGQRGEIAEHVVVLAGPDVDGIRGRRVGQLGEARPVTVRRLVAADVLGGHDEVGGDP